MADVVRHKFKVGDYVNVVVFDKNAFSAKNDIAFVPNKIYRICLATDPRIKSYYLKANYGKPEHLYWLADINGYEYNYGIIESSIALVKLEINFELKI